MWHLQSPIHQPHNYFIVNQGNSLQYYVTTERRQLLLETDGFECISEALNRGSSLNKSCHFKDLCYILSCSTLKKKKSTVICLFYQSFVSRGNAFFILHFILRQNPFICRLRSFLVLCEQQSLKARTQQTTGYTL